MKISKYIFFIVVSCVLYPSCKSLKPIQMSECVWEITEHNGLVVNSDTSYCFSLGNVLIPNDLLLIGNVDSLKNNKMMYKYVQEVLYLSRLENSKILVFIPQMDEMFVELAPDFKNFKPNSISNNMLDENPWTGWIRDDDLEIWNREDDEMYTNVFIDRRSKLILVVDFFNYGNRSIARIQRIQTATKKIKKIFPNGEISSIWADVTNVEHLEAISHWIDSHRSKSFENYKIGYYKNIKK